MIIAIQKFYEKSSEDEKIDSDVFLQQFIKPLLPETSKGKNIFS